MPSTPERTSLSEENFMSSPVEPPVPPASAEGVSPKTRFRINRGEAIADIVFTVVWISVAASWTNILAALDRVNFPHEIPVPSAALIDKYYLWIVNVALIGIAVSILKLIIGRWTFPVGVAHTVYQSLNAMVTVAILNSGMLLRPETAQRWAELSDGATVTQVLATVDRWGGVIGILVSIAIGIDIIVRWVDVVRCSSESDY